MDPLNEYCANKQQGLKPPQEQLSWLATDGLALARTKQLCLFVPRARKKITQQTNKQINCIL